MFFQYFVARKAHQLPLGSLLPVDCPGELVVLTPDDGFSLRVPLADLPEHFLNVDLVCPPRTRSERQERRQGGDFRHITVVGGIQQKHAQNSSAFV